MKCSMYIGPPSNSQIPRLASRSNSVLRDSNGDRHRVRVLGTGEFGILNLLSPEHESHVPDRIELTENADISVHQAPSKTRATFSQLHEEMKAGITPSDRSVGVIK
jgi:hypothetical protein